MEQTTGPDENAVIAPSHRYDAAMKDAVDAVCDFIRREVARQLKESLVCATYVPAAGSDGRPHS